MGGAGSWRGGKVEVIGMGGGDVAGIGGSGAVGS